MILIDDINQPHKPCQFSNTVFQPEGNKEDDDKDGEFPESRALWLI